MKLGSCGANACFMIEMEATSLSAAGSQNRVPCGKPEARTLLLVPEKKPANPCQLADWLIFQSQAACLISWVEKVIFERWEFQACENALGVPQQVSAACMKTLGLNIKNLISRCFKLLP